MFRSGVITPMYVERKKPPHEIEREHLLLAHEHQRLRTIASARLAEVQRLIDETQELHLTLRSEQAEIKAWLDDLGGKRKNGRV